jgi:hypothetical protein
MLIITLQLTITVGIAVSTGGVFFYIKPTVHTIKPSPLNTIILVAFFPQGKQLQWLKGQSNINNNAVLL